MARGPLGPTNSLPARYPPISTYLLPRQKNDLDPDARIDGTRLAHRSSDAPTRQAGMENQPGPRIRQPCKPALTVASARNRKYSDPSPYFLIGFSGEATVPTKPPGNVSACVTLCCSLPLSCSAAAKTS